MDLQEKVAVALRKSLHPEHIELENDDGVSGFVVSEKFRGLTAIDRQTLIDNALRRSSVKFSKAELRQVLAIAALTQAEYAAVAPRQAGNRR